MMVPLPLPPVVIVVGKGDRCANQACRHGGSGEARAPQLTALRGLFASSSILPPSPMQHFAEIASALRRP